MMNEQRLLTIKNLQIEGWQEEKWKPVVKGIDLHLNRGEVLGLIGESGAGKSTIGLAAMGYARKGCRISGGSINFHGKELREASERELENIRGVKIAYVAQSAAASFNPSHQLMTQFAEIPLEHGLMTQAEARQKAVNLYTRLFLPDPEGIGFRYPHQVSGGQLQRAMVAMAMACDPDIIVFDEPTTALDVTTQIEVLSAIKDVVRQSNCAAIYITHDLAVVAQLADRIMVLQNGLEVEEGDARSMLHAPKQEYTARLLAVRRVIKEARPPVEEEPLMRVEHITAAYKNGPSILHDVSFNVHRGRTVAVVGESGSGKTSVARVITGFLPQSEGMIYFDGIEMSPLLKHRDKNRLRKWQMIFQMPDVAINPRHKVKEIIGRPISFYYGLGKKQVGKRVGELLDMIELDTGYLDRYPSELSGGEKQRICIARALAASPELIICDEITSALDQLVAEEILKLLQRLQDELNMSYLFITHDLATVKAIADDVVVMYQGRVVEQGPRQTVFTPPHHEYTELLLSSVPEMDPDWLDNLLKKREQKEMNK
ncbi:MAG: ABC transporter ATP-binding protein [Desulfobacterium sp.]|jgi:peptide/nickel transport system ATP-binding protein|nr:ABC transporter ATP-binding protein [Desulfobacterium sp.]